MAVVEQPTGLTAPETQTKTTSLLCMTTASADTCNIRMPGHLGLRACRPTPEQDACSTSCMCISTCMCWRPASAPRPQLRSALPPVPLPLGARSHQAARRRACRNPKRLLGTAGSAAPTLGIRPAQARILRCRPWLLPMLLRETSRPCAGFERAGWCRWPAAEAGPLALRSAHPEPLTTTAFRRIQHRRRSAAAGRPRRALQPAPQGLL